jgi:hypothetical protein
MSQNPKGSTGCYRDSFTFTYFYMLINTSKERKMDRQADRQKDILNFV